jgi:hypothetical protein
MHLAAIVLVRDEADIFPAFAQHLAALFDIAIFMDHGSTDGTSELIEAACAGRPRWARWSVAIPGYHQSLFSTFAMRHVFANTNADAVFFLDADEFIDVPDKATLEAALAPPRPARCVLRLAWINALPAPVTNAALAFGATLLAAPTPSEFQKIIITRALFDATGGKLAPQTGNHTIDPGDGQPVATETIGVILHLPLRSLEQMRRKTVLSALAHHGRLDRAETEGTHIFDGLARIAAGQLIVADLIGAAAAYGQPGAASTPKSLDDLRRDGFVELPLAVAHVDAPVPAASLAASRPWPTIAAALLAWRPEPSAGLTLVLDGTTLRRATAAEPPVDSEREAAAMEPPRAAKGWRLGGFRVGRSGK